jgi:hypothetical protein
MCPGEISERDQKVGAVKGDNAFSISQSMKNVVGRKYSEWLS